LERLSARERDVLELAVEGFLDKQICRELHISENTLRTYWSRIRSKLGPGSRVALASAYVGWKARRDGATDVASPAWRGWILTIGTGTIMASDDVNDFHRLERSVPHPAQAYCRLFHPDDREATAAGLETVARGELDCAHLVFRLVNERGAELVNLTVVLERDGDGEPARMLGFRTEAIDARPCRLPSLRVGSWSRTPMSDELQCDDEFRAIFSLDGAQPVSVEVVCARLHSGSADAMRVFGLGSVADGHGYAGAEAMIVEPGGSRRWIRISAATMIDGDGVGKLYGTVLTVEQG
jgi:DNA-binding CsgD family transcriptional regulator